VRGFTASSYGDAFADVYDEWYAEVSDVTATVDLVRSITPPGGSVLELGVGTGRLALPMAAAGLIVVGVDASSKMLDRLAQRDPGRTVVGVLGDMVDQLPDGHFDTVLCAYNTLFNLTSIERQQACFVEVAERLTPSGRFVVEAVAPSPVDHAAASGQPTSSVSVRSMAADRVVLGIDRHDPSTQLVEGQFVEITEAGGVRLRPWQIRYSTVAELDSMAGRAGLMLVERFGDVDRRPFDADSPRHVSVWALSDARVTAS
jgi:SAM-dependent methyltransferase